MTAVATESVTAEAPVPVEAGVEAGVDDLVLADMLVEEISIDGMCGVY
jgi:mycofactocin precursor